jgi:hypothetical protein
MTSTSLSSPSPFSPRPLLVAIRRSVKFCTYKTKKKPKSRLSDRHLSAKLVPRGQRNGSPAVNSVFLTDCTYKSFANIPGQVSCRHMERILNFYVRGHTGRPSDAQHCVAYSAKFTLKRHTPFYSESTCSGQCL